MEYDSYWNIYPKKMVSGEVIKRHSTLANFLQKKQSFMPHNGVEKLNC